MIATKAVYAPQLDKEAAALAGSTHVGHGLAFDASNNNMWCVGQTDVCASVATAYESHVAVFPAPPNANATLIAKLNGLTLAAGGEGDQIRQAVIAVLKEQPAVPAV